MGEGGEVTPEHGHARGNTDLCAGPSISISLHLSKEVRSRAGVSSRSQAQYPLALESSNAKALLAWQLLLRSPIEIFYKDRGFQLRE